MRLPVNPLGLPVVPDEYSMGAPKNSSSMGVTGKAANCSSSGSNPSMCPPTDKHRLKPPDAAAASMATSAKAAEATNSFALQLVR